MFVYFKEVLRKTVCSKTVKDNARLHDILTTTTFALTNIICVNFESFKSYNLRLIGNGNFRFFLMQDKVLTFFTYVHKMLRLLCK